MVDQAHSKEDEAKETIKRLQEEIENLTRLVEEGAGLTMGQEHKLVLHCLKRCCYLKRSQDKPQARPWSSIIRHSLPKSLRNIISDKRNDH